MLYANNYRGMIPVELYVKLQNEFPQQSGESDALWLRRVKTFPSLYQKMFGTAEFQTELMQAVQRRTMAMAGARRAGQDHAGPALTNLTKPGARAKATIAERYRNEFMDGSHAKFKDQAYALLLEQFDAVTPANGSIFWNGINELALAKLVDEWNGELQGEVFGQLEATTAARYVNKKFVWEDGPFKQYFTDVSDRLGHAARGHVTSVVRCGLRDDSIFTVTELPRMLSSIDNQLKAKQQPTITDITIVVIEPKLFENQAAHVYTNLEIDDIPIVRPTTTNRRINGRGDCVADGKVPISFRVREYWMKRGKRPASAAATRIIQDVSKLIRW